MNNVLKLRKRAGLKQETVARAAGVARPTVSEWERQKKDPSGERLFKLADFFNVSTSVILGLAPLLDEAPEDLANEDKELWELREAIRQDPERKELLKLARYGSKQDVQQMVAIMDAMRSTNPDFYDGEDPS